VPRLVGIGSVQQAVGPASARSGSLTERSSRTPRRTPRELTGSTPRQLGVQRSFKLDDLDVDSDLSDSDGPTPRTATTPRPPLPPTPRSPGTTNTLPSPRAVPPSRSFARGSTGSTQFAAVPESDLEQSTSPTKTAEDWEVVESSQVQSDTNANDLAAPAASEADGTLPAVESAASIAAPAVVAPGGGEAARVFSAALRQEDDPTAVPMGTGAAVPAGAGATGPSKPQAVVSEPAGGSDSPPGEKPIPEATPDHSPIRPSYSARSPTPQVVDNLLGQLMEDVFTPRGTHHRVPQGLPMPAGGVRSVPPNLPSAPVSSTVPVSAAAAIATPVAAAAAASPATEVVPSTAPPTLEKVSAPTPAEDPSEHGSLPPTPPTAGKHDGAEEEESAAADVVTGDTAEPANVPAAQQEAAQGSSQTAAPGTDAGVTAGAVDSEAPVSEELTGPPSLQKSSLSAGADMYERRMGHRTIESGVDEHAKKEGPPTQAASGMAPAPEDTAKDASVEGTSVEEMQPDSPGPVMPVVAATAGAATAVTAAVAGAGAWLMGKSGASEATNRNTAAPAADDDKGAEQPATDSPMAASPDPEALVARTEDLGSASPSKDKPPVPAGATADLPVGAIGGAAVPAAESASPMALYSAAAPAQLPSSVAAELGPLEPTALAGEEQQPLQEALQGAPAAPQPGAASQAASLAGGVPPSTPPRGFAAANGSDPDLAAGMPITPAPSLSKELSATGEMPRAPPPTPVTGVSALGGPPGGVPLHMRPRMPSGLSHMSPAVSTELPHAPPSTPTDSPKSGSSAGLAVLGAAGGAGIVGASLLSRGSSVNAGGDPEPPSLKEAATEVAEAKAAAEEEAEGTPGPTESGPPPAPSAGASASFAPLTSDAEASLATVSPIGPPPGVGTKGADEVAVGDLDAPWVSASGAPVTSSGSFPDAAPASAAEGTDVVAPSSPIPTPFMPAAATTLVTSEALRQHASAADVVSDPHRPSSLAGSTSSSHMRRLSGVPPGVGTLHADDVMPDDVIDHASLSGSAVRMSASASALPPPSEADEDIANLQDLALEGSTAASAASSVDGTVLAERSTPLPAVAEANDSETTEGSEDAISDATPSATEAESDKGGDDKSAPSGGIIAGAAAAAAAGVTGAAAGAAALFGFGKKDTTPSDESPESGIAATSATQKDGDTALASAQQGDVPEVDAEAPVPLAAPAATAAAVGNPAAPQGLSPLKANVTAARHDSVEGASPNSLAAGADFADMELAHLVTSGGGRPEDALMGISPLGAHPGGASPFATSSPAGTQVVALGDLPAGTLPLTDQAPGPTAASVSHHSVSANSQAHLASAGSMGHTPQGGSPTGSQSNLSGLDMSRSKIPGGLATHNPGMKPEEVAAALGAKVNPNSASVNSLSAGADAADAALAKLKGSPGSSLQGADAAAAALDSSSGVAPSAPATEGQKSAEAGAGAHVVSAFAPEVTVKPVSSAADAGGNKPALEKPQTVEVSADYPEAAAAAPSAPLASAQEAAPVAAPAPAYSGVSAFANVTGGEYDEAVPPQAPASATATGSDLPAAAKAAAPAAAVSEVASGGNTVRRSTSEIEAAGPAPTKQAATAAVQPAPAAQGTSQAASKVQPASKAQNAKPPSGDKVKSKSCFCF